MREFIPTKEKWFIKMLSQVPFPKILYYACLPSINLLIKKKTKCQTFNMDFKKGQRIYRSKHMPLPFNKKSNFKLTVQW